MRLLLAGLVLFAVGVGLKEYRRRNPPSVVANAGKDDDSAKTPTPAGPEALLETDAPGTVEEQPKLALEATAPEKLEGGFERVLSGAFHCGNLKHGNGFAVFVHRKDGNASLVRVAPGETPSVLATRKGHIAAVAVGGDQVLWAEDGLVMSVPADGSGGLTVRARFKHARVTSLAASGGTVVAALVPTDADVLSDQPEGAIARIDSGGVKLVAGLQVRAHDVATDGKEAVWVAGYPSGLSRATLDGSSGGRIAERADGPVVVQADGVIHRYPQTDGPEIRRVGRQGGSMQTLVVGDTDWLDANAKALWYTTAGFGARLYEKPADGEAKDVLGLGGASAGVAAFDTGVAALVQSDDVCSVLLNASP